MKPIPRILPLVGVAIGGVLAVNALSGAQNLPELMTGARAFAEDAMPKAQAKAEATAAAADKSAAPTGEANDAAAAAPARAAPAAAKVCAPTAAELAKEAGLSPAELQVLQSLGARRGQLDQRERALDVQLALLAAAEAKIDAKTKALNGLKTDIQGLLKEAEGREDTEVLRLVKVYEGMKAKDAAARIAVLDDSVRLPIAAKMKERALSAVLAAMPAAEAKKLTESLARRYTDARNLAADAQRVAAAAAAAKPVTPGKAPAAAPKPAKAAAATPAPAPAPAQTPAPKAG
jgi:flagellar motility protein MotE (MotC chaperone)